MTQQPQLRVDDVGTTIRLEVIDDDVVLNLVSASLLTMKLFSPSGEVAAYTATKTTDGSDGLVEYTTLADELYEAGPWTGQLYVELGSRKFHTTTFNFQVAENLALA